MTDVATIATQAAIRNEIKEIVCEILEIEPFELSSSTVLFARLESTHSQLGLEILLTLQCAFGVHIDRAETWRMVNLKGVWEVLDEALAVKHTRRDSSQRAAVGSLN